MPKTVLIICNEQHIQRLVKVNLDRQGYIATIAIRGFAVLEQIKTERPDVVVLDLAVEDVDGAELLTRIEQDPEMAKSRVLKIDTRSSYRPF